MSIDTMNITTHLVDEGLNGLAVKLPYSCDSIMAEPGTATAGQVSFSIPGRELGMIDLAAGPQRLDTGPLSFVHATFAGFDGEAALHFRAGGGAGADLPGVYLAYSPARAEVTTAGAVTGGFTFNITGDTFSGTAGQALPGVSFAGLPQGLTAVATKTGERTAQVTFSGTATGLAGGESVSVTVSFGDASFAGGDASAVTGTSRMVTLVKEQPAFLTYSATTLNIVDNAFLTYSATTLNITA